MVTDPSLCPIPPGFELIGGFNDDFINSRNGTGYDNFKGNDGIHNYGVSKRWKNPNIRSAGIVCGFQFKIGPTIGSRFKLISTGGGQTKFELLGEVDGGDINVHFPRRDGPGGKRGGYIVSLKWYRDGFSDDGRIAEASLDKEIPHGTYGEENNYRGLLGLGGLGPGLPFLPGRPNSKFIEDKQIRDGQWHSFLAVIDNGWHRGRNLVTSDVFPIIGLWYCHKATSDFKDFRLLGMGADVGNMPPTGPGPLKVEIGKDQHPEDSILDPFDLLDFPDNIKEVVSKLDDVFLPGVGLTANFFGGDLGVGDDLAATEHPLQIRIDDVPLNELEIRNVYAASVFYAGIRQPQGNICGVPAKAIIDAQAKIEDLERQMREALENMTVGFGGPKFKVFQEIHDDLVNIQIPNARSDLSAAEFIYGRCVESFSNNDFEGPGGGPTILNCEPFAKKVRDAQLVVNGLSFRISNLKLKVVATFNTEKKNKIRQEIKDIQEKELAPAEAALAAAKIALDKCMKGQGPVIDLGPA